MAFSLMVPGGDGESGAGRAGALTYRDFLKFPNDGNRHELIDGKHYVTPSPFFSHQVILGNLYFHVRLHLEAHPTGRAFLSPFDVIFSMFDIVEPDMLYVSNERSSIVTRKHVRGAPDLVVEIGSESTADRDEGVKLQLYDRFAIREYWVVDPEDEMIRIYRRRSGRLSRAKELRSTGTTALTSPLLPGMSVALAKIFEG